MTALKGTVLITINIVVGSFYRHCILQAQRHDIGLSESLQIEDLARLATTVFPFGLDPVFIKSCRERYLEYSVVLLLAGMLRAIDV